MTIILNKVGLLLFAYLNSMIVAWLILNREKTKKENTSVNVIDD